MRPIVSKQFCSKTEKVFTVRKRPCVANGGGFVIIDNQDGSDVFRAEGCGEAVKRETILKDSNDNFVLCIRKQVGLVQVLCLNKQWKGLVRDEVEEGHEKPVFKATAAASLLASCASHPLLTVTLADKTSHGNSWDYKVVGSFLDRECAVYDSAGNVVAEVKAKTGIKRVLMKDVYTVSLRPGMDQAFIFGIVAVLERLSEN